MQEVTGSSPVSPTTSLLSEPDRARLSVPFRTRIASRAGVALALVTALTTGCNLATTPASPGSSDGAGPSGPLVLGIDWARAPSVERPVNFDATLQPGDQRKHPILRIPGQAIMADVVSLGGAGLVAVGYVPPAWTATAWTSRDGSTWSLHPIDSAGFTFPVAVAAGRDGSVVAIGRSGSSPVAWTSADGA